MKQVILAAGLVLGIAVLGSHAQAATAQVLPAAMAVVPQITPVWWAAPSTVCFRRYYGAYCRPARPILAPRYYGYNRYWVPGHWH